MGSRRDAQLSASVAWTHIVRETRLQSKNRAKGAIYRSSGGLAHPLLVLQWQEYVCSGENDSCCHSDACPFDRD
jgi:hypothetical protein